MQYEVEVNGLSKQVTVNRREGRFLVALGERHWLVDAASVGGHTLSLLMEGEQPEAHGGAVESREVSIAVDPATGQMLLGVDGVPLVVAFNGRRWKRKGDAGASGTGPERLTAPMPGKVVRVLARTGDRVAARQPVVVIEAMKMENELRASKDGAITDVLVREGQSVEAGTLLAIITPP